MFRSASGQVLYALEAGRVVSPTVSSMGLQGTISLHRNSSSYNTSINSFHGHISYQLGSLFQKRKLHNNSFTIPRSELK